MVNFAVELSIFGGPMDLLLYLVRREELEVTDLSLAKVTAQYLNFLEVLQEIDIDSVADFLEPIGLLIEMKARDVLPSSEPSKEEAAEILEDPSDELVKRLIDYRRYRDLAGILDERGRDWQLRYTRRAIDQPTPQKAPVEQTIVGIEIWDLVSAFGRILRERQPAPTTQIVYDETPIHSYMNRIHGLVKAKKRVELQSLFEAGQHKSALVGMFLATLELTRHHGLRAEQTGTDGPMWLTPGPDFSPSLDIAEIDNLRDEQVKLSNLPMRPR
ncbi:MAG: ScpA family protein [Planctomycetota bacterium]|nr:ScpA family protein [Planctomycetota bacterium]